MKMKILSAIAGIFALSLAAVFGAANAGPRADVAFANGALTTPMIQKAGYYYKRRYYRRYYRPRRYYRRYRRYYRPYRRYRRYYYRPRYYSHRRYYRRYYRYY